MGQTPKSRCNSQRQQGLRAAETVLSGFSVGQPLGHLNAADLLRQQAAKMQHAIVHDVVIDADGRIEAKREFHYLTCRRCALERQADFIEGHR